jgi:CheY-like chemotaxis protein
MSDWDFVWSLQKLPALSRTRILLVAETQTRGFIIEARKVLQKPVVKEHLARLLGSFSTERNKPYILIIEDEQATALFIKQSVSSLGWATQICRSAEDALAHLDEAPLPSLVLLDLMLPGMTGQEFSQKLTSVFIDLPIVVITGKEIVGEDIKNLNACDMSPLAQLDVIPELCRRVRSLSKHIKI